MSLDSKIFKAYDIRGLYPQEINEENLIPIVQAIYTFFSQKLNKENFTVAVGRDMRLSSPPLFEVIKETLLSCGANVVDLGLVSTPTFYFAVSHFNYDTGIQLTASHNPKDYNGLKFVMNTPTGLVKIGKPTGMEEIKELALNGVSLPQHNRGALSAQENIVNLEVDNALSVLGNPSLSSFKIVADPANAMAALYLEALFNKIPGELIKMNFELDGTFPAHQADPLQFDTLVDLQKRVIEEKADLGLAPDGDGDRMFFINEKGEVIPATIITALVARELLKQNPGAKILFDLRSILTPKTIVEENGGIPVLTKVGHAFITEQLGREGGVFAGEGSGHYYYQANGNAESQLVTVLSVLKVLTEEGKKLSEIQEELQRGFEAGEKNFEVHNASDIIAALKERYSDGELLEIDGVAISYPDWRFSVRTSNTEPLLRLNVEAYKKEVMEKKRDELVSLITNLAQ